MAYFCKDHELVGGWSLTNGRYLYMCTVCGFSIEKDEKEELEDG